MGRLIKPPLAAFLSLALVALGGHFLLSVNASAQAAPPLFLVLGDSVGFGRGATDPETGGYAALAYESLRTSDRYGETGLDFMNLSVPGATSADLLEDDGQLEVALDEIGDRDGSDDGEVEIIALDIGGNDLLNLGSRDSPCVIDTAGEDCLEQLRGALRGLESNLTGILTELRAAAPEAIIVMVDLYNPYSGTESALELIANAAVQQFNGVIAVAAGEPSLDVRMAAVYQVFVGRGNQWIASDGIHPNDAGHAVIAEVAVAAIDGREPQIPEELLNVPTAAPNGFAPEGGDDGVAVWVLIAGVIASFAAGALVSGTYFVARGRA